MQDTQHNSKTGAGAPAVGERSAIVEMLIVALPAVATMTSYTVMQFVDKLIVGQNLGPDALAAVGNGGLAAFVPASIVMGILTSVNTYVAQHLGAGRPERGAAYAWNGMWICLVTWAVFLLPIAAALPWVFTGMRGALGIEQISPAVGAMEVSYGRILLVGMVLTVGARGISHFFYGIHRPVVVMVATFIANAINLLLTWTLVTGAFGAPALGIQGAAIATVIGGGLEVAIPMAVFLSPAWDRRYGTRCAWRPSTRHIREIMRIGWPAGVMFGNELTCWWIFMAGLVAKFDPPDGPAVHNAAAWAVLSYMHMSFMPAVGFSIAVQAVVGKCIGAGRPDLAVKRTWLGLRLAMTYMGACALVFVLLRHQLIAWFDPGGVMPAADRAEMIQVGATLLILAAAFQVFDAIAITIVGALRGAGDTVWPGVATIILSWSCIVGGGWLAVTYFPRLESIGPWIAASAYVIILSLALLARFMGGKWRELRLTEGEPDAVSHAAELCPAAGEGLVPELPGIDLDPDRP